MQMVPSMYVGNKMEGQKEAYMIELLWNKSLNAT